MNRNAVAATVAVVFAAVLFSFLIYTRQLADSLRRDAEVLGELYALSFSAASGDHSELEQQLMARTSNRVLAELRRLRIPVVITDTVGMPLSAAFLPFEAWPPRTREDTVRILDFVTELDAERPPLEPDGANTQVHFGEAATVRRLRWIPWLQAIALLAVVAGGAWLILTSFRHEKERIWSAMARESAHQMGTPLSSLVGWLENLESIAVIRPAETDELDVVEEMAADVDRLLKVSNRFELIGRKPKLEPVRVDEIARGLKRYFATRLPTRARRIRFEIDIPPDAPPVRGNATLLEWAFENLIKNSLDALAGQDGVVGVRYGGTFGGKVAFQVYDDGPGVAPNVRGKIFEIGVTTKERGWGVGLSLARRIIEDMHDGAIQLEPVPSGASFRVELPTENQGPS